MKKWSVLLGSLLIVIVSVTGCGIKITIGDEPKTKEQQMEDEIAKILEDSSIDETLAGIEQGVDTKIRDSEKEEIEVVVEEEEPVSEKQPPREVIPLHEYNMYDCIYSERESEGIPYISGEYEEIDYAFEVLQKYFAGDKEVYNVLLSSQSSETEPFVLIGEDRIKQYEKKLKLYKIQLDMEEDEFFDTEIYSVEYNGFENSTKETGVELSICLKLMPQGQDIEVTKFVTAYVVDYKDELGVLLYF
ncbi:hypothetical protein QTL86_00115 [Cellulosilyticum sp. ST5]|uniref:hypothetical protein n=1 Tax=unclassified Cellulosilyticum TaxID=2643091 RepID=UPI000F8EF797|nr:hypothetical protein [Cellulosilyticum sp. WCF-2]QEH70524.1 hypothetical protein EKH84_19805 [Cellulosilyticum sp. WCF-2]